MVRVVKTGKKLKEHFAQFYAINPENGCWEWHRGLIYGYGQYTHNYKNYRAHRFSWLLFNGPLPDNFYVCHTCDNRKCVNPQHLWLGNAKDNYLDCKEKNRHTRRFKLNKQQREEIIYLRKTQNLIRKVLAEKFKVSIGTIQKIIRDDKNNIKTTIIKGQ